MSIFSSISCLNFLFKSKKSSYKISFMDHFGSETLYKEYKAFFIDYDSLMLSQFTRRQISELIYNKFNHPKYYLNELFNQSIMNSINTYLVKYVPINCASFTKSIYEGIIDKGILHIGVNDDGYLTGIPYNGILSIDIVKKMLLDIVDKNLCRCIKINQDTVQVLPKNYLTKYFNKIKIDIQKMEINTKLLDLIISMNLHSLKLKIKQNKVNKKKTIEYFKSIHSVHRYIKKYSCSLCYYVINEELKLETIEYIKLKLNDQETLKEIIIQQLYNTQLLDDFVKLYENPGPILNSVIDSAIIDSTSFIYWIMEYKDYMTTNKKLPSNIHRPRKPIKKPKQHISLQKLFKTFILNEGNTNAIFLKLFPNINLYSVSLEFPKCYSNSYIQFFNPKTGLWEERTRMISYKGPENRP